MAIWTFSLIKRIDKAYTELDNLFFIPTAKTSVVAKEAIEKYNKL